MTWLVKVSMLDASNRATRRGFDDEAANTRHAGSKVLMSDLFFGERPMILSYNLNGYAVEAEQSAVVALALDVAEGQIDVEGIAGVLKSWARPLTLPDE